MASPSLPTVSLGVSMQAAAASSTTTTQKLPTCIPMSTSHNVTPSGSSVHLPNSNLSIQLKPFTPRTPVIQIRQDAGSMFGFHCRHFVLMMHCVSLKYFADSFKSVFKTYSFHLTYNSRQ